MLVPRRVQYPPTVTRNSSMGSPHTLSNRFPGMKSWRRSRWSLEKQNLHLNSLQHTTRTNLYICSIHIFVDLQKKINSSLICEQQREPSWTPHFNRSSLGDTCHLPNSEQIHRSPFIGDARGASLLHVAVKRQALPVILELLRHRAEVQWGLQYPSTGGEKKGTGMLLLLLLLWI